MTGAYAQNGLEKLIVEKYYISNADDSTGSVGILPTRSVTYRIYADMLPGYKFEMAYGSPTHPLYINTTTSFFNNEDRGATSPTYTKAQAKTNTVMLDSWLSAGAACVGNSGILKAEDNGVANVVNLDGILQNADTSAGIPLTIQDGLIAGTPGTFGTIGIDSAIAVFDATSQLGNSFSTSNGAWYCLVGAYGPDSLTNKVLIAQITTDGQLSFKLNIQIGTPAGDMEKYVADNPVGTEILMNSLTFVSDPLPPLSVKEPKRNCSIAVSPNPSDGIFNLNINTADQSSDNYYTIYDILGTVLLKKNINGNLDHYKESIDIRSFAKGIYFLYVSINGVRTTNKLIKN